MHAHSAGAPKFKRGREEVSIPLHQQAGYLDKKKQATSETVLTDMCRTFHIEASERTFSMRKIFFWIFQNVKGHRTNPNKEQIWKYLFSITVKQHYHSTRETSENMQVHGDQQCQ